MGAKRLALRNTMVLRSYSCWMLWEETTETFPATGNWGRKTKVKWEVSFLLGGTRERGQNQNVAKKHLLVPTPVLILGDAGSDAELCLVPPKQLSLTSRVSVLHRRHQKAILPPFAKRERVTLNKSNSMLKCPRSTSTSKTKLRLQLNFKLL